MQKYYTPAKQTYYPTYKSTNHRNGDWICYNCHNLNYSFRKKCNRCKIQTRQQNQIKHAYSYYYYVEQHRDYKEVYHNENILTPPKNNDKIEPVKSELPSVSPLLKKYKESRYKVPMTASKAITIPSMVKIKVKTNGVILL